MAHPSALPWAASTWRRILVVLLAATCSSTGCVTRRPADEAAYAQFLADSAAPQLDPPYSGAAAFWLSVAWPGAGHWYLGEIGRGFLWSTVGLPLWPFFIPAATAARNARVLNHRFVGQAYTDYLERQRASASERTHGSSAPRNDGAPRPRGTPIRECPSCHGRNSREAAFCGACGTSLDLRARVGAERRNPESFCGECGARIDDLDAPSCPGCGQSRGK